MKIDKKAQMYIEKENKMTQETKNENGTNDSGKLDLDHAYIRIKGLGMAHIWYHIYLVAEGLKHIQQYLRGKSTVPTPLGEVDNICTSTDDAIQWIDEMRIRLKAVNDRIHSDMRVMPAGPVFDDEEYESDHGKGT